MIRPISFITCYFALATIAVSGKVAETGDLMQRESAPDAYLKRTEVYVGCMH